MRSGKEEKMHRQLADVTPEALAKCLALTFPPAMVQLVQELVAPVPAFDTIARIIQSDPVLSATVLTLVNSPYYGLSAKVTNLERAAVVLGTREILKIALSISFQHNTSRAIKRNRESLFADWRLSVWSAIAAEHIAQRTAPKEAHLAYLGSLLKDLSLFMYLCLEQGDDMPDGNACFLWLEDNQLELERQRWGETHADLSRTLLSQWGLPESILDGIANHHNLLEIEAHQPLTQCIILATRWAELQHGPDLNPGTIIQFELQMRSLLKLEDAQLESLRDECTQRFESLLNLLGIQNATPDNRFYAQSLQSMQSFYFHAMEISHTTTGVDGIARIISRHLRWKWGLEKAQLALRTIEGGGFTLFTISPEGTEATGTESPSIAKLPWKVRGEALTLGPQKAPYGELRFQPSGKADPAAGQQLRIYSRFMTTALATYYNEQAVVLTKAQTLQSLPVGVALVDLKGTILDANQRFLSFQRLESVPAGTNVADLLKDTLSIHFAPLLTNLLAEADRPSISQLFCSVALREAAKTPCLYLSVHRHDSGGSNTLLVLLEDVTEISAMEMQALQQRDFLERLVSSMQEFIATVDLTGTILWTAPASGHLQGKNLFTVTRPAGRFSGQWTPAFLEGAPAPAVPVEVTLADGTQPPLQLELIFSPLLSATSGTTYLVVGRDLTVIRRLEDKIRQQAMFDGLTGLFNYSQFNAVLGREVERSARTGRGMGLVFFDLDGFKKVNDTYGHQAGDKLLKLIAKGVLQSVRKGMDFPCRYGGDEFAVVVTEVNRPTLEALCERLHAAVRKHCQGTVSLSMGVAQLRQGETAEQLLQRVDRASYQAKNAGGAQTVWAE